MHAEEKEFLRHAILANLAPRHPAALPTRALARRVRGQVDFAARDEDVEAACLGLVGLGLLRASRDPLGHTRYFSATAQGVREQAGNPIEGGVPRGRGGPQPRE